MCSYAEPVNPELFGLRAQLFGDETAPLCLDLGGGSGPSGPSEDTGHTLE